MSKRGFTMVETLVAITILLVGVLGPLTLAARGISDGLFAQNQLTANLLAQEALEAIINHRNSNVLSATASSFDEGIIPAGLTSISTIGIDTSGTLDDQPAIRQNECTDTDDENNYIGCLLTYDEVEGFYLKAEAGDAGLFRRKVAVSRELVTSDELKIEVTISWKNKDADKSLTVVEYIYAE